MSSTTTTASPVKPNETLEKRRKQLISKRSKWGASLEFNSYGKYYGLILSNPWTPQNTEGVISLCIAENFYGAKAVRNKLQECRTQVPETANFNGYFHMQGVTALREAVAKFFMRKFMKGVNVTADEIMVSCGTTSTLDLIYHGICDEDEGVIVLAPYYCAFSKDLCSRDRCRLYPAQEADGSLLPTLAALEAAKAKAEAEGVRVRSVLCSNPSNPTGYIIPNQTMKEILLWSIRNNLHFVSDEIYAESIFMPQSEAESGAEVFKSVAVLGKELADEGVVAQDDVDTFTHVIYGMSKDFSMNGYRVGFMWTKNPVLMHVVAAENISSSVAAELQYLVAELLNDERWTDEFLVVNRNSLKEAYLKVTSGLEKAGVPFVPVRATMFVWTDMRQWLSEQTYKGELELFEDIMRECNILLSPGLDCKNAVPGFFRVCFAAVSMDALGVAMDRLGAYLSKRKTTSAPSALKESN